MRKMYFLISVILMVGCTMVETESEQQTLYLELNTLKKIDDFQVLFRYPMGSIASHTIDEHIYEIIVPSMDGGYSKFSGKKIRVKDPEDYKNIQIVYKSSLVKELSVNDIKALPVQIRDSSMVYVLDL